MVDINELKSKLAGKKGQLKHIDDELIRYSSVLSKLEKRQDHIINARWVLQEVAKTTQQELEYHISGLVSMALASVFEDPYEFKVEFVIRRGRTECDLKFSKEGEDCNPLDASGGGSVDVASFALRVAFMSMENPSSRKVLILDEPFRFVSPDLQHKCSEMIREISQRMGLQVIMISHAENIIDSADKVFEVVKVGEISEVKIV
jgi:DNA repair exonuclease SbcCD ATPase subunit